MLLSFVTEVICTLKTLFIFWFLALLIVLLYWMSVLGVMVWMFSFLSLSLSYVIGFFLYLMEYILKKNCFNPKKRLSRITFFEANRQNFTEKNDVIRHRNKFWKEQKNAEITKRSKIKNLFRPPSSDHPVWPFLDHPANLIYTTHEGTFWNHTVRPLLKLNSNITFQDIEKYKLLTTFQSQQIWSDNKNKQVISGCCCTQLTSRGISPQ